MRNKEYKEFYTKSKVYKILDNSFYELRTPIKPNVLINWAKTLNVQEVVLPDVMYNYSKTKKLIKQFFKQITTEDLTKYKWQAVVCGKTQKDMIKCFDWMNDHPYIDVIGFSRRGCKWGQHDKERHKLVNLLAKRTQKPIHLLGANGITDYFRKWHPKVRSIDSKQYAKTVLKVETLRITDKATEEQKKLFKQLIQTLK